MKMFRILRRDNRGAAAVEFALAVPILITFIYGIFQVGLLFQASAGMQHALGEGARFATLFPTPTDAQIRTRIENKVFGNSYGTFAVADPVPGTSDDGSNFTTLSVTYSMPMNFLFFPGPTVSMSHQKQVYVAPGA